MTSPGIGVDPDRLVTNGGVEDSDSPGIRVPSQYRAEVADRKDWAKSAAVCIVALRHKGSAALA